MSVGLGLQLYMFQHLPEMSLPTMHASLPIAWLVFVSAFMGIYGVRCIVNPDKLLQEFMGNNFGKMRQTEIGHELTKRLGIVYLFGSAASLLLIYCTGSGPRRLLCFTCAAYNAALCLLIKGNQNFWAHDGAKKNVPFVFLNIIFGLLI